MYKIGELARLTGLSTHTLRFYEKQGLLASPRRSAAGYRQYDEATVQQGRFILQARECGFSLEEIGQFLAIRSHSDDYQCQQVKALADARLATVRQQLAQLQQLELGLVALSHACCGGPEAASHCSILSSLEPGEPSRESCHDVD